jgi:hypothetical protein
MSSSLTSTSAPNEDAEDEVGDIEIQKGILVFVVGFLCGMAAYLLYIRLRKSCNIPVLYNKLVAEYRVGEGSDGATLTTEQEVNVNSLETIV